MLGVAPFNRIIELSPSSGFYYVPCALTQPKENEVDCNQYKTYLQNAYMASKIQSSATNIDDYCKSVRFHTPRNKRVTNPKPWNRNFNLRTQNQRSSRKPQPRGISAIQLISNQPVPRARPTFQNKNHVTRALPIPDTGHATSAYPPLPPRNNPSFSVAPENSNVPPVPPKMRPHSMYVEKAPPPPDMPARPPPLPSSHSSVSEDHLEFHTRPSVNDESIWEVWGPAGSQVVDSSKHDASPGSSQNSLNELTKEVSNENNSSLHEVEQFDNEQLRVDSPSFPIENKTKSSPVQKSRTSSAYENTEIQFKPVQTESDEGTQDAEATQLVNLSNDVVNENEDQTMMGLDRKSKIYENLKEALLKQKQDDINESPLHNGYEDTTVPKICFNNEDGTIVSKDSAADLSSQRRNSIDGSSATQARPVKQYVLPPEDWVPPDNPETMTVNDVSYALRFIGLSEDIVELFHNERIDGQILTELNIDILTNDFYLSQLHRFKISRFLEGWRPKLS
nr:GRB2-associated and regulator of MAPK protein-like [Ciona intestinalis]|eukprot:XP_004226745.2 GRB2-associated and regulator of MAPK protein-like [Ciona intestinalis]